MKRRAYKRVTEKDFEQIKSLVNMGLKHKQISQITGRGSGTIQWISRSKNFAEYKEVVTKYLEDHGKLKTPKEAKRKEYTTEEKIVLALESINQTLMRMADAWERRPEPKKSIFGR